LRLIITVQYLPFRQFDNFQFVELSSVVKDVAALAQATNREKVEAEFSLRALMEVPDQYKVGGGALRRRLRGQLTGFRIHIFKEEEKIKK
jgi:hypothetical protein